MSKHTKSTNGWFHLKFSIFKKVSLKFKYVIELTELKKLVLVKKIGFGEKNWFW